MYVSWASAERIGYSYGAFLAPPYAPAACAGVFSFFNPHGTDLGKECNIDLQNRLVAFREQFLDIMSVVNLLHGEFGIAFDLGKRIRIFEFKTARRLLPRLPRASCFLICQ